MPTISTTKGHCLFHPSGCLTKPGHLNEYNSVNKFSHEHFCFNDECSLLVGTIPDESLGDRLLVSFIVGRRPSDEAVLPSWVKLNDKYDRLRHSAH